MKKNTLLAVVLSMMVITVYMFLQQRFFPPVEVNTPQTVSSSSAENGEAAALVSSSQEDKLKQIMIEDVKDDEDASLQEESFIIETKLIKAVFTNRGGDIVSYKLKEHSSADRKDIVEMIKNITDGNRAFSLSLGNADNPSVNFLFKVKRRTDSDGKQYIAFIKDIGIKNSAGDISEFKLVKEFIFHDNDYMFTLNISLDGGGKIDNFNFGNAAYTVRTPPQIGPEWIPENDKNEYRNFASFSDGKMRNVKVGVGKTKEVEEISKWAAVYGKYFALAVYPSKPVDKIVYSTVQPNPVEVQNSQIFITSPPINANKNTDSYKIYIGPNADKFLSRYNLPMNNPYGLNDLRINMIAQSGGLLRPLEIILKFFLEAIYKLIPNWGVSILVLTLLMRLVFFPLTKKSSRATRKMQEMQPEIKAIQEKYKGNQQRQNAEMAKLYKDMGHNPLSGCLPMLIQLPFLFAMYRLFNNYFEFRGASFIPGWIPDLSAGDSIFHFGYKIPILGWTDIRLLPVIYLVSQLVYGKITQMPNQENPSQAMNMKIMLYFMPVLFFFMFYNVPSGLLLFWTASNFLMLFQQIIINKALDKEEKNSKAAIRK